MGTQLYSYTRSEHEYSVRVPQLMANEPELVIYLSAHGGGTVGQSYRANGWDYAVYERATGHGCADGCYALILEGSDIRSPEGRPVTHAETARSLASFLSAAGESLAYGSSGDSSLEAEYSKPEREWLAANYERLGLFSYES